MRVTRRVDDLAVLRRQVERLSAALRAVEWYGGECPACGAELEDGHRRGCTTSIALGEPGRLRGGGWHVSVHLVQPGDELRADVSLYDSRRAALARARTLEAAGVWLARVQRGRGVPRLVLQVDELRFPGSQVALFAVDCTDCGASFHPPTRGKSGRCPACRERTRAEFFADKSRARRAPTPASGGLP